MKDGLDFSGSCHFLCTLFSLTFCLWPPWLPATPHAASEKTLHHILVLCNPLAPCTSPSFPLSIRLPFFLTSELVIPSPHHFHLSFPLSSDQVFSPPLSFLCYLTSPPHYSLHLILPSRHVKTPASCGLGCVCEYESMQVSMCIHACVQSYILDFGSLLANVLQDSNMSGGVYKVFDGRNWPINKQ